MIWQVPGRRKKRKSQWSGERLGERDTPTKDSANEGPEKVLEEESEKVLEDGEMTLDNSAES
ncbi:MAG TPA: hypothetical protein VGO47_06630 [Chlamydiales bacterium]|nr:hypothetical protein [Chlamydiales bacterium]